MLVSTRSRYGLRALATMVRNDWTGPVSLSDLSKAEDVSQRYLEQIFIRLREGGIVRGRRGPGGGYVLSREPSEITLLEIITILEDGFLAPSCVEDAPNCSTRSKRLEMECPRQEGCTTRKLWQELRRCCYDYLGDHTLTDLVTGALSEDENVEIL